jgi:hypothetical protein
MANDARTAAELNKLFTAMADLEDREKKAHEQLNDLRISNAKRLANLQLELLGKKEAKEIEIQDRLQEYYLRTGVTADTLRYRERLKALEQELNTELAGKSKSEQQAIREAFKARQEALDEEFKGRLGDEKDLRKTLKRIDDKEARERKKQRDKEAKERFNMAAGILGSSIGDIFQGRKIAKARDELISSGVAKNEDQANQAIKAAQADAVYKALANFAKQLENTATEVAEAQTEIDTRLQGSKNAKSLTGSYWKEMSFNIGKNIGMSPFLKQETATKNLQTLVGKGIAFNVEQRAFLDTISEKIATTFEATDASLLKLVRIQQADSTAARLGMESALTAFLNNMYETTEYMTEAADSIRTSIYEASALMTAEDATEFEYQVQKWMGSLYSVGFQNTQGLSEALGKLAAGDIGGVTDNGYGNLLVMAANKANLSIAEILADGLNDDETNALMQAMVEYLGGIYNETKENKVVAQQFANVYGLTASDLKAAANLASSTTNVYKNNLNYGGLLQQLTDMANSMGSRTAIGTMVNNVIENFKYSTAATIGSDPVLYTMYTVASMLDDTVGGISIPSIGAWAMGNGTEIDLETTVADIMRTGAMAGGLLGGIGKMISGLGTGGGFSGSGMLKAFGISLDAGNTAQVQRGSGTSLLTTDSGMDVSLSGFIGNEDGDAVKNKMLTDEKDAANQQAIQALEEAQEIGLSNVDEHVVQIYRLLEEVINGSRNLHVTFGGSDGMSWSNTSGFSPSGVPIL